MGDFRGEGYRHASDLVPAPQLASGEDAAACTYALNVSGSWKMESALRTGTRMKMKVDHYMRQKFRDIPCNLVTGTRSR